MNELKKDCYTLKMKAQSER